MGAPYQAMPEVCKGREMTPTPINLSKATPREIECAVAQYVAGWTKVGKSRGCPPGGSGVYPDTGIPRYLSDAEAILGLLEKADFDAVDCFREDMEGKKRWSVQLYDYDDNGGVHFHGHGDTFPLAAATALLRAAGVECGEG